MTIHQQQVVTTSCPLQMTVEGWSENSSMLQSLGKPATRATRSNDGLLPLSTVHIEVKYVFSKCSWRSIEYITDVV